ncbi:hypothetical protein BC937DRAFT_87736 [Endogone sp. FLAS-F59071]|nr:hypothetical protein BC937DRAFT_87736 [Endogone sp. FLAS-F59071]|eukprot:RUS22693.1 hypothetical protein BC937DRAFT_87736 [Endogone sp. FLAS-F59071]
MTSGAVTETHQGTSSTYSFSHRMGNKVSSATPSTATAGIDSYVAELGDIQYEKRTLRESNYSESIVNDFFYNLLHQNSLGSARFMKTIRGRHKDGSVVVKIFVKPEPGLSLKTYVKTVQEEHDALAEVPNAFAYQRLLETEKAAYLVRQYFYSSLYDRISTRPFLNLIEKKWITYQILCGVADAHAHQVYHGDIKTENVQVTSWNWAYITDFASFKPTYLPEDNPADFSFFFDTSSRRTCYLAPERFYKPGSDIDKRMSELEWGQKAGELTAAMDIFSVGCVIAELFLEGASIFSLSQLFKYRSSDYDPGPELDKIEDDDIKALVKHMIQLDPTKRYTAEQYLNEWCDFYTAFPLTHHLPFSKLRRGAAFPQYFYTFLHQYISSVTDPHNSYLTQPPSPQADLADALNSTGVGLPIPLSGASSGNSLTKKTDADENIERVYHDFDKIAFFLGFYGEDAQRGENGGGGANNRDVERERKTLVGAYWVGAVWLLLPPTLNIPNYDSVVLTAPHKRGRAQKTDDGALIFLSLICAMVRNTAYPSPKLMALDMLLAIGEHLTDDIKLDRLVPYLVTLLQDDVALVRASTVRTLTQLLCMVESISPINARIFPEYILPGVRQFATDKEILVRGMYATCIAQLAGTALRFLEMTQLLKADGALAGAEADSEELDDEATYDASLHELQSIIQEQVTTLLIDQESAVKRALLTNITSLCIFFGRQKANDVLLSHMITYLNDRDWMLRCCVCCFSSFFESIIGVGTFVGGRSLEEYILPLMIQALTDSEEFVVEKVLNSLTSLAELGLFQKMKLWELVGIIVPLLCHPSTWIRYGTVAFVASAAKLLPPTDVWCIIYPLVRPFLKADVAEISELSLMSNVKSPLPRQVFDQSIAWASKSTHRSVFWKQARDRKGSLSSGLVLSRSALTHSSSSSTTSSTATARVTATAAQGEKQGKSDEYVWNRKCETEV